MPLVRVTMIKGKSPDYIKKMSDSIYEALVEAYQMAENDLFQIIEQGPHTSRQVLDFCRPRMSPPSRFICFPVH
jgi:hypothetical protein